MAECSKIVKTCGISEEELKEKISEIVDSHKDAEISFITEEYETRIVVKSENDDESVCKKSVKSVVKELKNILDNYVYTTEKDKALEEVIVELLVANDLSVSVVESCTGGMLSSRLVDVPGVSEVYKMGVVSYSNKAKKKVINVKKSSLQKYGAVSEVVAEEMVRGMALLSKSDVVVSTTGIAGPDGGTDKKPVGLVYIGCYVCGRVAVKECHFEGNRNSIRRQATTAALCLLREQVLLYISEKMFS